MATVELSAENFKQTIDNNDIVIIDFWASWCGPCRMFAPTFEAASEKHTDVKFAKVDTEAQQQLAGALQIRSIPTLMLFREGVLLFRESGALPAEALDDIVRQAKDLDMDAVRAKIAEAQAAEGNVGEA